MKFYELTEEAREANNVIRIHPLLFVRTISSRSSAFILARVLDKIIRRFIPIEFELNSSEIVAYGSTKINSLFYTRWVKELKKRGWTDNDIEYKFNILTHSEYQEYLQATIRKQIPIGYDDNLEGRNLKRLYRRHSSRKSTFRL